MNDIPCVGKLLGDGFRTDTVPHLVILAVTNVIDVPILLVVIRQPTIRIHVVDNLTVFLILESVRQVFAFVTNQLVNHRLEDYIEVLGQEIFFARRGDRNPVALVKERVAKFPERQHLVRKILILNLQKPRLAIPRQIPFELRRRNQLVIELRQNREPILVLNVFQNRMEEAKKLLLPVDFLLAIDDRGIDWRLSIKKNSLFLGDGLSPVDPVVPAVLQLRDEHEEVAIALLKIDQRQYNVQERVAKPFAPSSHLRNILVQNDIARGIRRLENRQRPVNPNRKAIDEITFALRKFLVGDIYDILRFILAKNEILFVRIRFQKHLRQNKDRILQPIIPIIPYISDGDFAVHRLKGTFPQDLVNRPRRILIPLDDNLHGSASPVINYEISAILRRTTKFNITSSFQFLNITLNRLDAFPDKQSKLIGPFPRILTNGREEDFYSLIYSLIYSLNRVGHIQFTHRFSVRFQKHLMDRQYKREVITMGIRLQYRLGRSVRLGRTEDNRIPSIARFCKIQLLEKFPDPSIAITL